MVLEQDSHKIEVPGSSPGGPTTNQIKVIMKTIEFPKYSKHALSMITEAVKRNKLMDSIPEETYMFQGVLAIPFFNDHSIAIPSVVLVGDNGRLYFFASSIF